MDIAILTFEKYEMLIHQNASTGITSFLLNPFFSSEALKVERRKIYIVKEGSQYLYVGEANTSIKTRFQRGFTSYRY